MKNFLIKNIHEETLMVSFYYYLCPFGFSVEGLDAKVEAFDATVETTDAKVEGFDYRTMIIELIMKNKRVFIPLKLFKKWMAQSFYNTSNSR